MHDILVFSAVISAAIVSFTIAGVAGFGAGLVMLPILIWVLGITEAVPALGIAQFFGGVGRAYLYRKQVAWKVVAWFALGAIPASTLGGFLFIEASKGILLRILGASMLVVVVYSLTPLGRRTRFPVWVFTPLGGLFGFMAAFLGIPGPFLVSFYLAYGLQGGSYLGTASMGMIIAQVPKMVVFGNGGLFTDRALAVGLVIGLIAILGAYTGRWIGGRIPAEHIPKIINGILVASSILFLVKG